MVSLFLLPNPEDEEEEDEQVKKEQKIPATKTAMIKALFDKVNGLKKEEVSARFGDLMGIAETSVEDLGGEDPATAKSDGFEAPIPVGGTV